MDHISFIILGFCFGPTPEEFRAYFGLMDLNVQGTMGVLMIKPGRPDAGQATCPLYYLFIFHNSSG